MDLRIFTEPQQGATYEQLLAVARATEDLGFDAFFRSDHYARIGGGDPGPGSSDAWLTLAGLARETSRIRLGTLVSPITFRLPGPLAISVAQVDTMSGGRAELGLGTGWFEDEHTKYGIPFYDGLGRFDRFEEQLKIVHGLLNTPAGETFSFAGKHYQLTDSPALPKPTQPHVPIILGGRGNKRGAALAAQYADEFNAFADLAECAAVFARVKAALAETKRELIFSAAQTVAIGRNDAEVKQRADAVGRSVDDLRANGLAGTPGEVVDRIGKFAEIGASRIYLQIMDLDDLDHLELIATEVARQL